MQHVCRVRHRGKGDVFALILRTRRTAEIHTADELPTEQDGHLDSGGGHLPGKGMGDQSVHDLHVGLGRQGHGLSNSQDPRSHCQQILPQSTRETVVFRQVTNGQTAFGMHQKAQC